MDNRITDLLTDDDAGSDVEVRDRIARLPCETRALPKARELPEELTETPEAPQPVSEPAQPTRSSTRPAKPVETIEPSTPETDSLLARLFEMAEYEPKTILTGTTNVTERAPGRLEEPRPGKTTTIKRRVAKRATLAETRRRAPKFFRRLRDAFFD